MQKYFSERLPLLSIERAGREIGGFQMINISLRSRTAAVAAPAQAPLQASSDEMLVARVAVGDYLLVEMENVGAIGRESRHPAGGCVEMSARRPDPPACKTTGLTCRDAPRVGGYGRVNFYPELSDLPRVRVPARRRSALHITGVRCVDSFSGNKPQRCPPKRKSPAWARLFGGTKVRR
jgi:hypothetical protein